MYRPLLFLSLLALGPTTTLAQAQSIPFSIPGSEISVLHSSAVGDSFEIHVATSTGEPMSGGVPVVFLLDSNEDFPLLTSIARRLTGAGDLPPHLIVGVGYPEFPRYYRSRDYTPSAGENPDRPSGGAEPFHEFLETELFPWVESNYGALEEKVLVGHSLGGLFGIHSMVRHPGVFDAVLASSPSVWWNERATLVKTERASQGVVVYTSLGSEETDLMTTSWETLREFLSHAPPQLTRSEFFEGENHSSVKPFAFSRGLRWIFGVIGSH